MASIYTIDKYFHYCGIGNVEAVYFCLMEGIDPVKYKKEYDEKNAFLYACQRNYVEMLQMLINNF